jgi:hypothetical protein
VRKYFIITLLKEFDSRTKHAYNYNILILIGKSIYLNDVIIIIEKGIYNG